MYEPFDSVSFYPIHANRPKYHLHPHKRRKIQRIARNRNNMIPMEQQPNIRHERPDTPEPDQQQQLPPPDHANEPVHWHRLALRSDEKLALRTEHAELTEKMRLHRWAQKLAMSRSIMDGSLRHVCEFNNQTRTLLNGARQLESIETKLNILHGPSKKAMKTFWSRLEAHGKKWRHLAKMQKRLKIEERRMRLAE